jgi:hypothetical protein
MSVLDAGQNLSDQDTTLGKLVVAVIRNPDLPSSGKAFDDLEGGAHWRLGQR